MVDVDHVYDLLVPGHDIDDPLIADPQPHDTRHALQRDASRWLRISAERVDGPYRA
jgi:hypothetical protein